MGAKGAYLLVTRATTYIIIIIVIQPSFFRISSTINYMRHVTFATFAPPLTHEGQIPCPSCRGETGSRGRTRSSERCTDGHSFIKGRSSTRAPPPCWTESTLHMRTGNDLPLLGAKDPFLRRPRKEKLLVGRVGGSTSRAVS